MSETVEVVWGKRLIVELIQEWGVNQTKCLLLLLRHYLFQLLIGIVVISSNNTILEESSFSLQVLGCLILLHKLNNVGHLVCQIFREFLIFANKFVVRDQNAQFIVEILDSASIMVEFYKMIISKAEAYVFQGTVWPTSFCFDVFDETYFILVSHVR